MSAELRDCAAFFLGSLRGLLICLLSTLVDEAAPL